jgi:hypothetical protein
VSHSPNETLNWRLEWKRGKKNIVGDKPEHLLDSMIREKLKLQE